MTRLFVLVTLLAFVSLCLTQRLDRQINDNSGKAHHLPKSAQVKCPAIGFFLGNKSQGLSELVHNKTGYCMNVTDTCCSVTDMRGIQKWWEDPLKSDVSDGEDSNIIKKEMSRSQIRKRKLENISAFTKEILKRHDSTMHLAHKVSTDSSADVNCRNSAEKMLNLKD